MCLMRLSPADEKVHRDSRPNSKKLERRHRVITRGRGDVEVGATGDDPATCAERMGRRDSYLCGTKCRVYGARHAEYCCS